MSTMSQEEDQARQPSYPEDRPIGKEEESQGCTYQKEEPTNSLRMIDEGRDV